MQASHRARSIAAALIVFGLTTAPLAAADKRPFASSDFTSLRSATPVAISPDGKAILFDVQSFDEKGPAKHEWHTVTPVGSGDLKLDLPEKFTPSGFTKDGALFGEYRIDDQTQLAIVPITSGTPAFQARSRLARHCSNARVKIAALAASALLPDARKSRVPFSTLPSTVCCTRELLSESARAA